MDYYSTLGLKRGASDADIKKAYRSMAMKHHPDRTGGDDTKFKEIQQAYAFLTDPEKKRMIDAGMDPNSQHGGFHHQPGSPFEFHFGTENLHDIFGNFGFGGFGRQPMRRNKSLNVNVEIELIDVLKGKTINAEIGAPGGKPKIVNIEIPPGIEHGQQIKYSGMGDASIPNLQPGDLIVNVYVRPHSVFKREGESLVIEKTVSVWDALLGSNLEIQTLDNKNLNITIPSGTQPETILSCRGEGLPNMRSRQRGNLLIKIKVTVPKNLTPMQLAKVQQLKDEL
jgi:DnaJ-class molecular chaperone